MKKTLFFIFILALFFRLVAVIGQDESEKSLYADAKEYDTIATNIVSGHGFSKVIEGPKVPTTRRTPLYPLFLSGIYAIFGHSYIAVKLIQALLGALFCIVIFLITNLIYNNTRISIIACIITALYKPFISGFHYYGGPAYVLSEYFYMFILGIAILASLLFVKKENKVFGILAGLSTGLAMLTRPEFVLFSVFLTVYLLCVSKQSARQQIKKYFIMYLFILLTIAPWTLRNYIVTGKFIPLSTLNGKVFLFGNNSLASGGWAYPENYDKLADEIKNLSEYERNRILLRKGIGELKKNPKRIPVLYIKKILVHWAPFEKGFEVFNPYYAVLLLFGSIGILFFRRRTIMEYILLMIFFTTTLTAVIAWGDPRYRYPYEFGLIIFTALAMNEIFIIAHRKRVNYGK